MAAGLSTSPVALQDLLLLGRVQEPTWCLWPNGGWGLHLPLLLSPRSHSVPMSLLRVPQPSPESWCCWPCRSLGALAADPSSCSVATGHSGSLLPPPRAPRVVLPGTVAEGLCCTGSNACSAPLPKPFCPCSHPIKLMEVGSMRGCSTHSAPSPGSPLPDPGMGHGGCPEPPTRRLPPILGLQPGATRREQTLGSSAGATTPQPPASPSHRAPPRGRCVGADGHRDVQPGRLRPSGPGHRGGSRCGGAASRCTAKLPGSRHGRVLARRSPLACRVGGVRATASPPAPHPGCQRPARGRRVRGTGSVSCS